EPQAEGPHRADRGEGEEVAEPAASLRRPIDVPLPGGPMKSALRRSFLVAALVAAPFSVARAFPDDGTAPAPGGPAAADAVKPVRDAWTAYQDAIKAMKEVAKDPAKAKEARAALTSTVEAF